MTTLLAGATRRQDVSAFWRSDSWFVCLALLHGVVILAIPSIPTIALGLWWNANTIAHNFIHRPFFRTRPANAAFSAGLSILLGFPQTVWRERHLAHHRGHQWRLCRSRQLAVEAVLIVLLWTTLLVAMPVFVLIVYLPGYVFGLALCGIQGHYEHARGTTSHYGALYNALCFNDGYHLEHHAHPSLHWSELPRHASADSRASRWPPLLRVFDSLSLEALERTVIRSAWLQAAVLRVHRTALAHVLRGIPLPSRICVVGGGLFPRTVLILQELVPGAQITVVDANAANLAVARHFPGVASDITYRHARFTGGADAADFDLVVFPLSFQGDRQALYEAPVAPSVIVHDWLWRRRGTSRIVSTILLKRVNLVRQ
jgi:fatty acid desaturase